MELIHIAATSLGSLVTLFLLAKLMGDRQMSQLSMFDYINGITIGSIAAEMATALESDFLKPLLAMIIYAVAGVLISFATTKSIYLRRIITGKSLIIMQDGKIYEKNLKKAHLDVGEFLVQCRNSGYFDIADLQTAIMEPNGKISFLPKSEKRPVNPSDLSLTPTEEKPLINVIIDGKLLEDNLKFTGNNMVWLEKQLHALGITKMDEVFLATCDSQNTLNAYAKIQKPMTRDIFE